MNDHLNKQSYLNHYPMYKASLLADEFVQESLQFRNEGMPKIKWQAPQDGQGESSISTYESGVLKIKAESPLAAAFALSKLKVSFKAGHLAEFLGSIKPMFPLRPLKISCQMYQLSSLEVTVPWPCCLGDDSGLETNESLVKRLCRRVIELGYNAIFLECSDKEVSLDPQHSLTALVTFIDHVHAFGLKVVVQPNFLPDDASKIGKCPLDQSFNETLSSKITSFCSSIPSIDYVFYESSLLHPTFINHPSASDATLAEVVTAELSLLESALSKSMSLIYFLPANCIAEAETQAAWMSTLCDDAGSNTIIAFSAVAGNYDQDHLPKHPFWEKLRKSPDRSSTKLMPLINTGMISQGEGLWPTLATDLIETYYSRLYRHQFIGVMAMNNALPKQGGLLDCNLWMAGQALWHGCSCLQIAETWIHSFHPEWHFDEALNLLRQGRRVAVSLSVLRSLTREIKSSTNTSEECRILVDSVLAQLKELNVLAKKNAQFLGCIQLYSRDVERLLLQFLKDHNLSHPQLTQEAESQESFWMPTAQETGRTRSQDEASVLFSKPNRGAPGSMMEAIYLENHLV